MNTNHGHSKCCKAPLIVRGSDEGTNHYECTKCLLPSDPMVKQEYIEESAIKLDGKIYTGLQHHIIIKNMVQKHKIKPPIGGKQGFVTNEARFVDREEGAEIAFKAGQIPEPKKTLFSEDYIHNKHLQTWENRLMLLMCDPDSNFRDEAILELVNQEIQSAKGQGMKECYDFILEKYRKSHLQKMTLAELSDEMTDIHRSYEEVANINQPEDGK